MPDEPSNELEFQEPDVIDESLDDLDDLIAQSPTKSGTSITDGSSNT